MYVLFLRQTIEKTFLEKIYNQAVRPSKKILPYFYAFSEIDFSVFTTRNGKTEISST